MPIENVTTEYSALIRVSNQELFDSSNPKISLYATAMAAKAIGRATIKPTNNKKSRCC